MKRISYLLILPILIFSIIGVVGCGNDDDVSCITGTIYSFNHDESDKFVFIGGLTMPGDKYSYIKTVVVPKDEFPLQNYKVGDIIVFNIVEIMSEYPTPYIGWERCTAYLCSIKLCNN